MPARSEAKNGRYVMIGGPAGRWISPLDTVLKASILSLFVSQKMGFMISQPTRDDLSSSTISCRAES